MIGWQCPVCQAPLDSTENTWRCDANHTFDRAKEGYTNLLLANQKRRPDPGDNREMLLARRAFLEGGGYRPLVDALDRRLNNFDAAGRLLDVGCGEGYYLQQLLASRVHWRAAGVDISREALRLAGRRGLSNATFAVASSKRLPLLDHQFDAVLNIFAPLDAAEARRLLTADGQLIQVSPGPAHLQALREFIYDQLRPHSPPAAPEGFTLIARDSVAFNIAYQSSDQLRQLLAMTPFAYKLTEAQQTEFIAQSNALAADFVISIYQPALGAALDVH